MSGFDRAPPPVTKAADPEVQKPAAASGAPSDRSTDFAAVEGHEEYSGGTLMVVAYAAIWVILMAWIFLLWRRSSAIGARLAGLEAAIDRAAAGKDGSDTRAKT